MPSNNEFGTIDLCWKAIVKDIKKMYEIPSTKKKPQELCNYAAKIRVELILLEYGIPLTYRKQWMYDLLISKQIFFIAHIPEIYIPSLLLKTPTKYIDLAARTSRGISKRLNNTREKLLQRCVNNTITNYQKHLDYNLNIKKRTIDLRMGTLPSQKLVFGH